MNILTINANNTSHVMGMLTIVNAVIMTTLTINIKYYKL